MKKYDTTKICSYKDIPKLVKKARATATQAELAEEAKVNQSTISRIEAGDTDITLNVARRVLKAAGWDIVVVPRASSKEG